MSYKKDPKALLDEIEHLMHERILVSAVDGVHFMFNLLNKSVVKKMFAAGEIEQRGSRIYLTDKGKIELTKRRLAGSQTPREYFDDTYWEQASHAADAIAYATLKNL